MMNKYETYKDSGIQWLGEVPAHWEIIPVKFSLSMPITDGPHETPEILSEGIPFISAEAVKNDKLDFNKKRGYISEEDNARFSKKYSPLKGDIYMVKSGATTGNVAKVETDEIFNIWSPLAVMRPNKKVISTNFLFYAIKSDYFNTSVQLKWNMGTQQNIGMGVLSNIRIFVPSLTEQTAIASYLDNKLGEIDTLIHKQETLLEKLAEQRTAIITQAVTKGLNADAKMKNSGVTWLGEVPEHWETWKITHAIDLIGSGTTPKSDNADYYDGQILWVTTSELRENFIDDTKQKITGYAIKDYSTLKIYPKNSVAIAMYGATIGRLGILSKEATFNQACCVFGSSKKLNYKFLFYWLWYRRPILISLSNGGGQPNLSQDDLKKIKIPLPPISEQTAIATYLDEQTAQIDCLSQTVNQAISKLKEYRSTLITQAVTGKIKLIEI